MLLLLGILAIGSSSAEAQAPESDAPHSASAQGATALWSEATNATGDGDDRRALELLDDLVREFPDSPLCDDALFLAGSLLEEKLSDPQEARLRYRDLLLRFPDSRSALAAQRRLAQLDEALGTDGSGTKVAVAFRNILQEYPSRDAAESIALAADLATKNPEWPQVHKIYLWLAAATRREGHLGEALSYYQRVKEMNPPKEASIRALLGIAEVSILTDAHARATSALETLNHVTELSAAHQHSIAELRVLLKSSQRRMRLLSASYVAISAMFALLLFVLRRLCGDWRATKNALLAPSLEVMYMLPVALLLTIMAMTGHREIGPAVAIICGGGLITTWLVSAVLEAGKPLKTRLALACIAISLLTVSSVCYVALQRSQLLDLVTTTVRFGPE